MDSTRQDRAPGGDDRRRLTPRIEKVEFDRNDFTTALIYFKDNMDISFTRKILGEFRLATSLGSDWYVRYREAANTFNWIWVTKRILRLTNPLTVQQLTGMTNKLIYLSGNLRGARRFHLKRGIVTTRLLDVDFPPPTVTAVGWDDKNSIFYVKWDMPVDFQGGSGEIIVQSADGTEYWVNDGSPFLVEDGGATHHFTMGSPIPGSAIDSGFYLIPAGVFVQTLSGKANNEEYREWNA